MSNPKPKPAPDGETYPFDALVEVARTQEVIGEEVAASPPSLDAPAEQINSSTTRDEPRSQSLRSLINSKNHGRTLPGSLALDIEVAEKVMGWSWQKIDFFWNEGGELYLAPTGDPASVYRTTSGSWNYVDDNPKRRVLFDLPQYSQDISDAFDVVDTLEDFRWVIERGAIGWTVMLDTRRVFFTATGETAPEAICRAALSAVDA